MVEVRIIQRSGEESLLVRDAQWLKDVQKLLAQEITGRWLCEQVLMEFLPRNAASVLVTTQGYSLLIALYQSDRVSQPTEVEQELRTQLAPRASSDATP